VLGTYDSQASAILKHIWYSSTCEFGCGCESEVLGTYDSRATVSLAMGASLKC
jgi:hypothetical protein